VTYKNKKWAFQGDEVSGLSLFFPLSTTKNPRHCYAHRHTYMWMYTYILNHKTLGVRGKKAEQLRTSGFK
jgi:hypothetical protein